MFLVVVESQ
jgi:hypothetical protein